MNQGLAPLKTSEYETLLKRWGFIPTDPGGNHLMFIAPDGINRFPISGSKVTQRELRMAARLVGVSRRVFLQGPPKSRPIRRVEVEDDLIAKAQAHLDEQVALAEQRAKENQMAKVIDQPKRPYTKGTSERVYQYVKEHPRQELTPSAICEALGVPRTSGTVNVALMNMASRDPLMKKLDRGRYIYGQEETPTRKTEQSPRNGNLRNEILALLEENEGRPMSIDLVVQKLGTVRSSTANALLSLSRIGAIDQLGRGIYQFKMPHREPSSVSDETRVVSTHPDDEPIDLVPTEQAPLPAVPWPAVTTEHIETATMWEEMKDLGDGRFLLRDENGELWVAKMQRLELI